MLEREVENVIEQHLRKNKWIVDVGFKNRQVYRQSPRTEEERNKLLKDLDSRRFPDFILYESNKVQKPIAIIETKRSEHKNLEDAKEQGMKYAKKLGAKFLFLYNFNRYLSYYVPNEKSLLIDNVEVNNILPLSILKKFTSNELKISGTAEIRSKSDLINLFRVANNKLREAGVNAGVTRFSEFSNLLFLKLVSDLNEERNYNIKDEFLWDTYKTYEGNALINYINNTVIDGLNKKFDSSEEDNGLFTPLH
ncbi:type I restriction enzyme HsdR N-terminal domain-containing protein, partial [Lactobacillus salivarius]